MHGAKYTPAGNSLRAVAETGWQLPFWDEIRDSQSLAEVIRRSWRVAQEARAAAERAGSAAFQ